MKQSAPEGEKKIVKKQLFIMLLLLLGIFGGYSLWLWGENTGWGNPDRAVQLRMDRAQQAVVDRNLSGAVLIYEELLESYPSHPQAVQALTQLAGAYHELKDYSSAVGAYTKLTERLQGDVNKGDLRAFTLLQIAKMHRERGDTALALDSLQSVRAQFPKTDWSGEALSEIGGVYQDRGDHAEAIKQYQLVIKELPRGFLAAEAQGRIGECLEAQGNIKGAIAAYQRVLEDYPSAVWDPAKAKIDSLKKYLEDQKTKKTSGG